MILGVLAVVAFAFSVVHFLRAEWYRQQLERQEQEFTAALQALRQMQHHPGPGDMAA